MYILLLWLFLLTFPEYNSFDLIKGSISLYPIVESDTFVLILCKCLVPFGLVLYINLVIKLPDLFVISQACSGFICTLSLLSVVI